MRRLLSDGMDGSRHQCFVPDLCNGQTVLVAHNIDLAERVQVGLGDRIRIRSMFEWIDLGGLIHWTHHDSHGVEDGVYIKYRRRTFQ